MDKIKWNHTRKSLKKAPKIQTSNFALIKTYKFLFSEMWGREVPVLWRTLLSLIHSIQWWQQVLHNGNIYLLKCIVSNTK
jgi:hypothetical protein